MAIYQVSIKGSNRKTVVSVVQAALNSINNLEQPTLFHKVSVSTGGIFVVEVQGDGGDKQVVEVMASTIRFIKRNKIKSIKEIMVEKSGSIFFLMSYPTTSTRISS